MNRNSALGCLSDRGAGKHGLDHWWQQRLSALALVPLVVWFVVSLLWIPKFDYVTVQEWMKYDWNTVLLISFVLVVAHHSYLGVRVIIEDYVHHRGARLVSVLLLRFAHVLIAMAGIFAVLKVLFGEHT
jgi:succinate dehydrogenase / fumarate reductase membrane anchor subunit